MKWFYRSKENKIIGYVERIETASGKQFYPNFKKGKNGNFTQGSQPIPRTLFGIQTLHENGVCYIVEGEKCASALHQLDLPAITSQNGASAVNSSLWTPLKIVSQVIIIPDKDKAGFRYVRQVIEKISELKANIKIFVLELPGIQEKQDIIDYFQKELVNWDGCSELEEKEVKHLQKLFLETVKERCVIVQESKEYDLKGRATRIRERLNFELVFKHFGLSYEVDALGKISSPFNKDKVHSFCIDSKRKVYQDFSTGDNGDIFTLIAELANISIKTSFRDVLIKSYEILGEEPPLLNVNDYSRTESEYKKKKKYQESINEGKTLVSNLLDPKTRQEDIKPKRQVASNKKRASRQDYFQQFHRIINKYRRDIFSYNLMYWDATEKVWNPAKNILDIIKSEIDALHSEMKYPLNLVDVHFAAFENMQTPRLCIDIPEWDGRDRIQELADRVILKKEFIEKYDVNTDCFAEMLKDWHSKMWQRLYSPEIQNRILILSGNQGIGKDFFIDENVGGLGQFRSPMTVFSNNERDTQMQLHNGLVLVVSEFDRVGRMQQGMIKNLITTASTNVRASHARSAKFRWSRTSFISSCNIDDILKDPTGNRRYIVFDLENINKDSRLDLGGRLQVLAQGRYLAKNNFKASDASEGAIKRYLDLETPQGVDVEVQEAFDILCNVLIMSGDIPDGLLNRVLEKSFLPNSFLTDMFFELGKRFGHKERKIKNYLRSRGGIVKFGGNAKRGFFFQLDNTQESIQTEIFDSPF